MNIPSRLYRYHSLVNERRNYTFQAISENIVYFARPSEFKDLQDCKLSVKGASAADSLATVKLINENGVLCLSDSALNLHLWGEYADNHQGVCIEYRTSEEMLFGCELLKVSYVSEFPQLSAEDKIDQTWMKRYVSTKSDQFQQECEWRVIFNCPGKSQLEDGFELTSVFLGRDIDADNRQDIINLTQERTTTTTIYQVIQNGNTLEAVEFT